mgnify:CR=1 FL=1
MVDRQSFTVNRNDHDFLPRTSSWKFITNRMVSWLLDIIRDNTSSLYASHTLLRSKGIQEIIIDKVWGGGSERVRKQLRVQHLSIA